MTKMSTYELAPGVWQVDLEGKQVTVFAPTASAAQVMASAAAYVADLPNIVELIRRAVEQYAQQPAKAGK